MSKETRTRGNLKRTKKKNRINPTPGRQEAIDKYEKHLSDKEHQRATDAKPCPCCGNTYLYVGVMSSDSYGVHCRSGEDMVDRILIRRGDIAPDDVHLQGCGLQLAVNIPDDYPADFPPKLVGKKAIEYLRKLVLYEAVRRWNQRNG